MSNSACPFHRNQQVAVVETTTDKAIHVTYVTVINKHSVRVRDGVPWKDGNFHRLTFGFNGFETDYNVKPQDKATYRIRVAVAGDRESALRFRLTRQFRLMEIEQWSALSTDQLIAIEKILKGEKS